MPIAPVPITASEAGGASGPQIASRFVQYGPSASPGIGGTAVSVPVANTTRSASSSVPSSSSIRCSPVRRACWRNTEIPASSKGFAPSPELASITSWARRWIAGRSTSTEGIRRPNLEASLASRAILALRSITLVGTQP